MNSENKSTNHVCEYCKKNFTTAYSLKTHQKTTKYCLEIQNKEVEPCYNCNYCNKTFNIKSTYSSHILVCREKKIQEEQENYNMLLKKVKELEKSLYQKDKTINELRIKLTAKEEAVRILEKENSKLIERPTIINNNTTDNRQQTQYNVLYNEKLEKIYILNEDNINNKIDTLTTPEQINQYNFGKFLIGFSQNIANTLKEFSFCIDMSRKVVVTKDENLKAVKMNIEDFLSKCFILGSESIKRHIAMTERIVDDKIDNYDEDLTSEMLDLFNDDIDTLKQYINNDKEKLLDDNPNNPLKKMIGPCIKTMERLNKE
jgi:hypothetical protein